MMVDFTIACYWSTGQSQVHHPAHHCFQLIQQHLHLYHV